MDTRFAHQLITQPEADAELFRRARPGLFWVERRATPEGLVAAAAAALGSEALAAQREGERLLIQLGSRRFALALGGVTEARLSLATLLALNKVLAPEREARYIRASRGGGRAAFMWLAPPDWLSLEHQYGKAVLGAAFARLGPELDLFGPAAPEPGRVGVRSRALAGQAFGTASLRLVVGALAPETDADAPALRPFAGELLLGCALEAEADAPLVRWGELRHHGCVRADMEAEAQANALTQWRQFRTELQHGVGRVQGLPGLPASSLMLNREHWSGLMRRDGPVLAVAPQAQLLLHASESDAQAVAALVEVLDQRDPQAPGALSGQLYRWAGQEWLPQPIDAAGPRLRHCALWQQAEQGGIAERHRMASFFDHLGLAAAAARQYRRGAERALVAPQRSDDPVENGAACMCHLGERYERGCGLPRDAGLALQWFQRAAALDHGPAMYRLGRLYQAGRGVPPDPGRASLWFSRAAALGHEPARQAWQQLEQRR